MNQKSQTIIRILFAVILLAFAVGFFAYKQYWTAFFTLFLLIIVSRWYQVKKLVVGKERLEVQLPEEKIKK